MERRDGVRRGPRALRPAVLLLLGFAACTGAFLGRGPKDPIHPFAHGVHLSENVAIPCGTCHDLDPGGEGFPSKEVCLRCHARKEGAEEKPYETSIAAAEAFDWTRWSGYFDLVFDHASHEEKSEAKCEACHPRSAGIAVVGPGQAPSMALCMDCHERTRASNACGVCHTLLREDVAPPDHFEETYLASHGRGLDMGFRGERERDCLLCHAETSCRSCHATRKPSDHGVFFGQRGHGLAAEMDRDRCLACHQEDSCVQCHSSILPQSHHASFGAPQDLHCLRCHHPIEDEGCGACHLGAPSHAISPPIPGPPHPPASSDCYDCHLKPPHPDNGESCLFCHK